MTAPTQPGRWPNGARAAACLTCDNMGEAADLNRNLWPKDEPVGKHYTVTTVIPQILALLKKYDIQVTYFIESWNTKIYGDFILEQIAAAGHEVAWHAWQHEAWSKLSDAEEKTNFERSFGEEGVGEWVKEGKIEQYRGFRPPGGLIKEHTKELCREHGLGYLSPAAEKAALVKTEGKGGDLAILPFKWAAVDAYFYMETFAGLRKMKGEYPEEPQSPGVLVERYIAEVDRAIEEGGFLAPLFHPFLTNKPERLEAMETVIKHMVKKRDEGVLWLARCEDVEAYVREHPDVVGTDPQWDLSSWR